MTEAQNTRLWCLHHIGADDLHPAPGFATAQNWADWANKAFSEHADISRFVVALWPWDATSHAAGVDKAIREFSLPAPGGITTEAPPPDVIALVIAAREALETEELTDSDALSNAVEAFASRVCYDDEGGSLPEAHADPCTCGRLATAANPEGMEAWPGGDTAPADWDGGPVRLRNGYVAQATHWGHPAPAALGYEGDNDIIAYKSKAHRWQHEDGDVFFCRDCGDRACAPNNKPPAVGCRQRAASQTGAVESVEEMRERCAVVARATIDEARAEGENDLRSVRHRVIEAIRALPLPESTPTPQTSAVEAAAIIEKLEAVREAVREAYCALDDSDDRSHEDEPVHAVPHSNAMALEDALVACENFAPPEEAWDGPGPLVTQIIEYVRGISNTPQTSDGSGPGSWVPAEHLVQANERIAELVEALEGISKRRDYQLPAASEIAQAALARHRQKGGEANG